MKKYTFDELTDKYIGEKGSSERNQFEFELKLDILGEMIKKARKEKKRKNKIQHKINHKLSN